MHPWDPLSCTDCHGGDGEALEEGQGARPAAPEAGAERRADRVAHSTTSSTGASSIPTDLRVTDKTCARCHSSECANMPKSLHGTTAGHLSDGLYENGITRNRKQKFAIFPTKDDDGIVPEHGYKSMPGIPTAVHRQQGGHRPALRGSAPQGVHAVPPVLARRRSEGTARAGRLVPQRGVRGVPTSSTTTTV